MLRSFVSIDAAFFATVDPATLLFTGALAEEPLAAATPLFLDNEFGCDDVNKFSRLAQASDSIGTLDNATGGDRTASARYREVLRPLGLGDELRVTLASSGRCWGVLCLHRQDALVGFGADEIAFVRRLAPYLGDGLRRGVTLFASASDSSTVDGPGVIIVGGDLSVVSINAQADDWLVSAPRHRVARASRSSAADLRGGCARTGLRARRRADAGDDPPPTCRRRLAHRPRIAAGRTLRASGRGDPRRGHTRQISARSCSPRTD